jgi:hypothetical protein
MLQSESAESHDFVLSISLVLRSILARLAPWKRQYMPHMGSASFPGPNLWNFLLQQQPEEFLMRPIGQIYRQRALSFLVVRKRNCPAYLWTLDRILFFDNTKFDVPREDRLVGVSMNWMKRFKWVIKTHEKTPREAARN